MSTKIETIDRVKKYVQNKLLMGNPNINESLDGAKICSQTEAIIEMLKGNNVFLCGPAGTGKTATIQAFIDIMTELYQDKINIAITATTGVAATLVGGGKTIHSWSGMGISDDLFIPSEDSFVGKKRTIKRIKETDVLIIDEISMFSADSLIKLDAMLKYARNKNSAFGGLQVIFSGDFLQLPPVVKKSAHSGHIFCFETDLWKNEANIKYCYLDKIHRAKCEKLSYVLNRISVGENPNTDPLLKKCILSRMNKPKPEVYSTLYTVNKDVDSHNQKEQNLNPNPLVHFEYRVLFGNEDNINNLMKKTNTPKIVSLKINDTVMVTSNFTTETGELIPNGLIAKILDIKSYFNEEKNTEDIVILLKTVRGKIIEVPYLSKRETIRKWKEEVSPETKQIEWLLDEQVIAAIEQIPLKLAYAITVHKSQGQTFDGVVCDLSKCFTTGLGYVALSRAQSLSSILIENISLNAFNVNPACREIMNYIKKTSKSYVKSNIMKTVVFYDDILNQIKEHRKRKKFFWEGKK